MNARTTLNRTLKPHWVWAIALGSSIGWGSFVQPTDWMDTAGPMGVVIGFGIGALLMMLIAVSYGFLVRKFPVSGGEFAYAYVSLGRTHAFISGWFLTLGYLCIVALNASAFSLMIKFVLPSVLKSMYMYTVAGWNVYFMEVLIATVLLAIFGYFNIRGSNLSGRMQFIFCTVMIVSIVILTVSVGFHPDSELTNMQPLFTPDKSAIAAILSIVAIAPWAYVGFDNIPQAAEEFSFSSKKAFTLIILAIFFAAALYSLMVITTSMIAPWQDLAGAGGSWGTAAAIKSMLGNAGVVVLVAGLTMGIFTGLNGFIMSSSRLLFAMSRAKIIPAIFSKLHPKYQTPYVGIIFTIVVSMLAPWFGREALTWVVDMSSVGVTIAYFYTCYTAFTFFKWSDDGSIDKTKYTAAPVKKVPSILGMASGAAFLGLLLIPGSPAALGIESWIVLLVWIVLGLIFYLIKRKDLHQIPTKELNYLILGTKDIELISSDSNDRSS